MFKRQVTISPDNDKVSHAFLFCARSISAKFQGEKLLRQKLVDRGYSGAVVDEAIKLCKEENYINDLRLANMVAENLMSTGRGTGQLVRQKLQQLGVGAEDIATALAKQTQEIDVDAALATKIARVFPNFIRSGDQKALRQVVSHFQRKGYSYGQILGAIKRNEADGVVEDSEIGEEPWD